MGACPYRTSSPALRDGLKPCLEAVLAPGPASKCRSASGFGAAKPGPQLPRANRLWMWWASSPFLREKEARFLVEWSKAAGKLPRAAAGKSTELVSDAFAPITATSLLFIEAQPGAARCHRFSAGVGHHRGPWTRAVSSSQPSPRPWPARASAA